MKKAVILHGTDARPNANWFPWLKAKFEQAGYEVWVPELPGNHTPNRDVYNDFLLNNEWDFANNVVVGHSSGAVEVLNLLMDKRCPNIKAAVLVSPWEHGVPAGEWEPGQFDKLFPAAGFDYGKIRSKCSEFAMIHAQFDPYCPLEQAEHLANQLQASLTELPVASHFGGDYPEFQELWEVISNL